MIGRTLSDGAPAKISERNLCLLRPHYFAGEAIDLTYETSFSYGGLEGRRLDDDFSWTAVGGEDNGCGMMVSVNLDYLPTANSLDYHLQNVFH